MIQYKDFISFYLTPRWRTALKDFKPANWFVIYGMVMGYSIHVEFDSTEYHELQDIAEIAFYRGLYADEMK